MPTTRKTPIDMSEYLPDEAALKAILEKPVEYNRNIDPKLRARLAELNLRGSDPEVLRVAPPSVAVYVKPIEIPSGAVADNKAGALPKVELARSPATRELPTMPSLRRIQGEPEVPGVVTGPATVGPSGKHGAEPAREGRRASVRTAILAVLAVLVPMIIVILLMGHAMRHPEHDRPAPAVTATEPAVKTSALPSATPPAAPTAASNATPTVVTSAAAPPPTVPSATAPAPPLKPGGRVLRPPPTAEPTPTPTALTPPPSAPPTPQPKPTSSTWFDE